MCTASDHGCVRWHLQDTSPISVRVWCACLGMHIFMALGRSNAPSFALCFLLSATLDPLSGRLTLSTCTLPAVCQARVTRVLVVVGEGMRYLLRYAHISGSRPFELILVCRARRSHWRVRSVRWSICALTRCVVGQCVRHDFHVVWSFGDKEHHVNHGRRFGATLNRPRSSSSGSIIRAVEPLSDALGSK